mmetsp:Transcript_6661/g.15198  ORF Transcript_6661/g.15198 Transcript_6661/m.15198 type:complete len:129 (+) Transcript_6661:2219-2605(+)
MVVIHHLCFNPEPVLMRTPLKGTSSSKECRGHKTKPQKRPPQRTKHQTQEKRARETSQALTKIEEMDHAPQIAQTSDGLMCAERYPKNPFPVDEKQTSKREGIIGRTARGLRDSLRDEEMPKYGPRKK